MNTETKDKQTTKKNVILVTIFSGYPGYALL